MAPASNDQRGVGAGIADVRAHVHVDLVRRDALRGDFRAHLVARDAPPMRRIVASAPSPNGSSIACWRDAADVGEPHAVGRQQRRERMDQHGRHAERVGDEARVLAAGAAEAVERVARHVVAALHGNLLDRVRHVLDRDLDEAVGDVLRDAAVADVARQRREGAAHRRGVERLVLRAARRFSEKNRG